MPSVALAKEDPFFIRFWDDKDNASIISCKEIVIFFPIIPEIKMAF
jgi:hypothetical protein